MVASAALVVCVAGAVSAQPDSLPIIKPDVETGFSNAGWKYDRYTNLPSLDAGTRMLVADLRGPGIIRHIHTTRHSPRELFARGIVLEITFDDAAEPAVLSPLADFFGDGCNGESRYFSTPLIECAPWSYNCYFPMPFKERARVYLRNDTDRDAGNYSYVEWEPLACIIRDLADGRGERLGDGCRRAAGAVGAVAGVVRGAELRPRCHRG